MTIKFWSHLAVFIAGAIVGIGIGVVGTAIESPEPVLYKYLVLMAELDAMRNKAQLMQQDCSGLIFMPTERTHGHVGIMRDLDELDNLLAKARQLDRVGKRSQPGSLSPETIRAIELQTAREMFSGEMRDPMERKRDMGQYRWEQQRCVEEQELGGER